MGEPNYDEDMKLPAGKTCSDCYAARFCVGIGCTKPGSTKCDYWPNRFRERVRAVGQPCPGGDLFPHRPTCDGIASALCERDDTARADLERAVQLIREDTHRHCSCANCDKRRAFLADLDTRSGT